MLLQRHDGELEGLISASRAVGHQPGPPLVPFLPEPWDGHGRHGRWLWQRFQPAQGELRALGRERGRSRNPSSSRRGKKELCVPLASPPASSPDAGCAYSPAFASSFTSQRVREQRTLIKKEQPALSTMRSHVTHRATGPVLSPHFRRDLTPGDIPPRRASGKGSRAAGELQYITWHMAHAA